MNRKFIMYGIITLCFIIAGIKIAKMYENDKMDLSENYMETNAKITFIGRTGTGINIKAKLGVNYSWENEEYTGFVTRVYKKEGYYNQGDTIKIYINKNNVEEIK